MIKFLITFILFFAIPSWVLADDSFIDRANGDTPLAANSDNEILALEANSKWHNRVQELLINALSLTGIQYTFGGKTPETGFDCSGFVRYVFSHAANLTLPHSARAISQIGKTVKKDELQPGDLVFFNTLKSAFSHVGIYLGDNKFIHAPRSGAAVRVEKMDTQYWASRFNGGQRLEKEVEADTQ